jgi:hypothetical protein
VCRAPRQRSGVARGRSTDQFQGGIVADLSGLKGTLENGAAANLLCGLGSAITYVNGDTFLAFWIANDNDFQQDVSGPNVFFVVGITDAEFGGSKFEPQVVRNPFPFFL